MNAEFFEALELLEKEKGIPAGYLGEKIATAINVAVKHNYKTGDNTIVELDPANRIFKVAIRKKVVENVESPQMEILFDEAKTINPSVELDGYVDIELNTKDFGRIAAQTAKHVIRQGIREVEREIITNEVMSRQHELITGVIQRIDKSSGTVYIEIGRTEAIMPLNEQIPGEVLHDGDHIKIYVSEVKNNERGPRTIVSRSHPGVVRRMFELEVPEIFDGTVEIMGISREPGSRTKVAVVSKNPDVDAIGSCIGPKGNRVGNIVKELNGEKIDLIPFQLDIGKYIAASLAPADVINVDLEKEDHRARVIVPDDQLSLAIGNKGQNVRLAAKLTGWRIDIKPESQADALSDEISGEDKASSETHTTMAAAFKAAAKYDSDDILGAESVTEDLLTDNNENIDSISSDNTDAKEEKAEDKKVKSKAKAKAKKEKE